MGAYAGAKIVPEERYSASLRQHPLLGGNYHRFLSIPRDARPVSRTEVRINSCALVSQSMFIKDASIGQEEILVNFNIYKLELELESELELQQYTLPTLLLMFRT